MDCRAIVTEIANYFADGYRREGLSFFNRSFDDLKITLRRRYFNDYRDELKKYEKDVDIALRPRTGNFISAVYIEILKDISDDRDLNDSISNGLLDRVFKNLKDRGYSHLFEEENR